jgi:transcriptional regulator with XRE-family HTH domain
MNNINLATKIKNLRLQKGLSQEKLADDSQLSLRTIQRIENGETEPRGYTLNRLAKSLGLTAEDLTVTPESTDKRLIAILNLSALSFIVFPLLGIIVPLTIWALVKEKTKSVNETARQTLNFQILWCIITIGVYAVLFTNMPVPHPHNIGRPEFILCSIAMLYAVNFVFIVINTLFGSNAKNMFYQPVVKFIR